MPNPAYVLLAPLNWVFSPIYYRGFTEKFDFLLLNPVRTSLASAVLANPAALFGFGGGFGYAVMLTSLSPLLTQVFSKSLGKESPSRMDSEEECS